MRIYLVLLTILSFAVGFACQNSATTAKTEIETVKRELSNPNFTPTPTPKAEVAKNGLVELVKLARLYPI